jgi:homeobox-leucine zipper protein
MVQMRAELQVLSPLVPIREVTFLRFCKQHAEGLWAVVDVSVDGVLRPDASASASSPAGYMGCRLLPSGCVVEDMRNGYSKVRSANRWTHASSSSTASASIARTPA